MFLIIHIAYIDAIGASLVRGGAVCMVKGGVICAERDVILSWPLPKLACRGLFWRVWTSKSVENGGLLSGRDDAVIFLSFKS